MSPSKRRYRDNYRGRAWRREKKNKFRSSVGFRFVWNGSRAARVEGGGNKEESVPPFTPRYPPNSVFSLSSSAGKQVDQRLVVARGTKLMLIPRQLILLSPSFLLLPSIGEAYPSDAIRHTLFLSRCSPRLLFRNAKISPFRHLEYGLDTTCFEGTRRRRRGPFFRYSRRKTFRVSDPLASIS